MLLAKSALSFTPLRGASQIASGTEGVILPTRLGRALRINVCARKYTRRATDEIPNPRDPFEKNTAWRGSDQRRSSDFQRRPRSKEPFDAELIVLFGLPALIILIPWAIKDPAALAIFPLVLLIPGIRDVVLAFLRDAFTGMRRAKQFVSSEEDDDDAKYSRWATRRAESWGVSKGASPPPPPPPFTVGGQVYDLGAEDFNTLDAAAAPRSTNTNINIAGKSTEFRSDSSYSSEINNSATAAVSEGWPEPLDESFWDTNDDGSDLFNTPTSGSNGDGDNQPSTDSYKTNSLNSTSSSNTAKVYTSNPSYRRSSTTRVRGPRTIDVPDATYADAFNNPAATTAATAGVRNTAYQGQQQQQQQKPSSARQRPIQGVAGRGLVRRNVPGKIGVDLPRAGAKEVPWYLVPLVALFPFLRFWGGFM